MYPLSSSAFSVQFHSAVGGDLAATSSSCFWYAARGGGGYRNGPSRVVSDGVRQPTLPALYRQCALLHTLHIIPTLLHPSCAKQFHRHSAYRGHHRAGRHSVPVGQRPRYPSPRTYHRPLLDILRVDLSKGRYAPDLCDIIRRRSRCRVGALSSTRPTAGGVSNVCTNATSHVRLHWRAETAAELNLSYCLAYPRHIGAFRCPE